jgi:hypothetical protein
MRIRGEQLTTEVVVVRIEKKNIYRVYDSGAT